MNLMNFLLQVKEFFSNQFISTIIGVLIGGILTLYISNITERKKISMDLKIGIWKKISDYLDKISDSIVEIETNIVLYNKKQINEKEMLQSLEKEIYVISELIPCIEKEISKNILIIQNCEDFTDSISQMCKCSIKKILDIKSGKIDIKKDFLEVESSIKNLDNSLVFLYGNLQSTLLSDLYTKRQINKIYK